MEMSGISPLIDTAQTYLFTYDGKLIRSLPDRSGFILYDDSENVSKVVKNPFNDKSDGIENTDTLLGVDQLNSCSTFTFCSRNNTNITRGVSEFDPSPYRISTETNDRNIDTNTIRDLGGLDSSFPVISNENEFNDNHSNRNIPLCDDIHYFYNLDQFDVNHLFDQAHISIQPSRSVILVDDIDNDLVELESMGNLTIWI